MVLEQDKRVLGEGRESTRDKELLEEDRLPQEEDMVIVGEHRD